MVHQLQPVFESYDTIYSESVRLPKLEADLKNRATALATAESTIHRLQTKLEHEAEHRGQLAEKITKYEAEHPRTKTALTEAHTELKRLKQLQEQSNKGYSGQRQAITRQSDRVPAGQ